MEYKYEFIVRVRDIKAWRPEALADGLRAAVVREGVSAEDVSVEARAYTPATMVYAAVAIEVGAVPGRNPAQYVEDAIYDAMSRHDARLVRIDTHPDPDVLFPPEGSYG